MNATLFEIISLILTTLTGGGVLGLFVGRKQRKADYQDFLNKALREQQESINLVSKANNDLLEELVNLRGSYSSVRDELAITKHQNEQLLKNQDALQEQLRDMELAVQTLTNQLREAGIQPAVARKAKAKTCAKDGSQCLNP